MRPSSTDGPSLIEAIDPGQVGLAAAVVVAAGATLAFGLWLAQLRWSWAALGLIPAGIGVLADSFVEAAAIASSSLLSCLLGLAWHRGELAKGGTEAQGARGRVGPLGLCLSALTASRWKRAQVRGTRMAVGQTPAGRVRTLPFGNRQGVRGFVPGGPGSGKTVSLTALALVYVRQRLPVICIDPKGDAYLRSRLEQATRQAGGAFASWSASGPDVYNPLGRGEPSEIADKALVGETWTEPHYLRQAQRYLGHALRTMKATGEWPPSLRSLVSMMEPDRLESLASAASEKIDESLFAYLESLSPRTRAELGGVRDRLAVLAESGASRWLDPAHGDEAQATIDVVDALHSNQTIYFALDADRYPLASKMLGASIIVDLISATGELQGSPTRGLVLIDEFAAIESDAVGRLLSRSRSAGISVVLATQALADLELAAREGEGASYRRQILSHVDFVLAHRQSEPEAASILAEMAGTRPEWATTRRIRGLGGLRLDGEGTRTRSRDFVRHPDEFKRLGVGRAIIIEPAAGDKAEEVSVWKAAA